MPKTTEKHTDVFYAKVDQVVQVILQNDYYMQSKRNEELIAVVKQQFNCSRRQACRYIKEAKSLIRKMTRQKTNKLFESAIRDREYIIRKYKKEDGRLALQAMQDREKLFNLYPDQNFNLNHSGGVKIIKDDIE